MTFQAVKVVDTESGSVGKGTQLLVLLIALFEDIFAFDEILAPSLEPLGPDEQESDAKK